MYNNINEREFAMNNKTICRNCFLCINYIHKIKQSKDNPVKISTLEQCTLNNKTLSIKECYLPHECCLPKADKIIELDDTFENMDSITDALDYLKEHYDLDVYATSDDRKYNPPSDFIKSI